MENIKVAIYCRVSPFSDEYTVDYLCNIQKQLLLEKAAASHFDVVACYEDKGYSGKNLNRPALHQMFKDHADGMFSVVLIQNRDCLFSGENYNNPPWLFAILSAQLCLR